jgi:hypothetical protein
MNILCALKQKNPKKSCTVHHVDEVGNQYSHNHEIIEVVLDCNIVRMKKIRNAHVILVGNLLENGHLARHGDGMTALRQSFGRL